MIRYSLLSVVCFLCGVTGLIAQPFTLDNALADTVDVFDYGTAKDYEIGGVTVVGAGFSDENAIISIAGFKVGDKIRIPGPKVSKAIRSLWKLRLFTDVQVYQTKVEGDVIFLEIKVEERPRLLGHSYENVKKPITKTSMKK